MSKLTDNEIMKVLECCFSNDFEKCEDCPLKNKKDVLFSCMPIKQKLILDLINRKNAKIEDLSYKLAGVMHSVDKWLEGDELNQDEVNRAITMREKTLQIVEDKQREADRFKEGMYFERERVDSIPNLLLRACSDAIKEFAERFEKEIETSPNMNSHFKYALLRYARQIKDNLVQEMAGDANV